MRCQIFLDAENISCTVFKQIYADINKSHSVIKCNIFGNLGVISKEYRKYIKTGNFKIYQSKTGKNSADLYLTTKMAEAIYRDITTELFIIISRDTDFLHIISLATRENKKVILYTDYDIEECKLNNNNINKDMLKVIFTKTKIKHNKPNIITIPKTLINYYNENWDGSTFLYKSNQGFVEVPFVNNMNLGSLNNLLTHNNLRTNNKLKDDLKDAYLFVDGDYVRYYKEEEYEI